MDAVDGNAIGGLLHEVFGTDMTTVAGTCASCGATAVIAQLTVYRQAPGTVVRCPACGAVLMVFVRRQEMMCVDLSGLDRLG